jgi:hypothetical protein
MSMQLTAHLSYKRISAGNVLCLRHAGLCLHQLIHLTLKALSYLSPLRVQYQSNQSAPENPLYIRRSAMAMTQPFPVYCPQPYTLDFQGGLKEYIGTAIPSKVFVSMLDL